MRKYSTKRNRRNTGGITNESKREREREKVLDPLGNTCRKSQPPNANIILIAIEKYRHYEETLFSLSFFPSFQLCGRATIDPVEINSEQGGGKGRRRPPRTFRKATPKRNNAPTNPRNDDSVETRNVRYIIN